MGTPQVAAMRATGVHASMAGALHLLLLALPVLTSVRFTPEGHSCCQFVIVEDAVGEYIGLNGDYTLKTDSLDLPDPICLDGCIYTKAGGPPEDEYCFREEATAGANVEQTSCPAITSAATGSTPITATSTTAEVSLEDIRSLVDEARQKVLEHKNELDSLLQDSSLAPSTVQALNQILTNLENMGSSMASIGSLGSGRLRRATSEDCLWMSEAKRYFEEINEELGNSLEEINGIFPPEVASLDSLLLEMKDYYEGLKTTYENVVVNLESSISGVCSDITSTTPITTSESTTASASTTMTPIASTSTINAPTSTDAPTTSVPTTTEPPTTTELPTTTDIPTTSTMVPTTTDVPTTTEVPTTTDVPTTTKAPTTTDAATTKVVSMTTEAATTTSVPTTTELPSTTKVPTTTEATTTPTT